MASKMPISTPIFGKIQPKFESPIQLAIQFIEPPQTQVTEMSLTSVLRKRRLKMKKHKLRKRRKAQRAERIKFNK